MNSQHKSKSHKFLKYAIMCIIIGLVLSCGGKGEVAVVQAKRGEIRESFTEPGKTRLSRDHVIVMPINGRIGRIDLEPGDKITSGQTLVAFDLVPLKEKVNEARAHVGELQKRIRVNEYDKLEDTILIETKKAILAFQKVLKAAEAQIEAELARSNRATKELARVESQYTSGVIAPSALDDAKLHAETALIDLRQQELIKASMDVVYAIYQLGPGFVEDYIGRKRLDREVLVEQLAQARAGLARAEHEISLARIVAPIDGVVLERLEDGNAPIAAGRSLLRVGNLDALEVEVDVLSQDALTLRPGMLVELKPSTGDTLITGRIKRVEPAGFTKLSSLGVEQQRVWVIVSVDSRPAELGVGYRLQARFITATKSDALTVPRYSVLQNKAGAFYVIKVTGGRLEIQPVDVGVSSDLEIEITKGLSESDWIASTPDANMKGGEHVKAKQVD